MGRILLSKYFIESRNESVTVSAGAFNGCLKIKSVGSRKEKFLEQYYLYAPEVGMIKYILKLNGVAALTFDFLAHKK